MPAVTRYATFNAVLPPEGPLSYRFPLDFAKADAVDIDMSGPISAEELSYINGVYVDNYDNPDYLEIRVANSMQRLRVPAGKAAYAPLMVTGAAQITCRTTPKAGLIVPVYMLNFPVWPSLF